MRVTLLLFLLFLCPGPAYANGVSASPYAPPSNSSAREVVIARVTLHLDTDGRLVSKNPVWNACVIGRGLSFDLIQGNTDRFEHRQGHRRIFRPWTCRDYHRGRGGVWKYRENELELPVILGHNGTFFGVMGDIPPALSVIIDRRETVAGDS